MSGARRRGDSDEWEGTKRARRALDASCTALRDAEGALSRRVVGTKRSSGGEVFGSFAVLPVDVLRNILSRLDGYSLAMVSCTCWDFAILVLNTDVLWYKALSQLEPKSLIRCDLVQYEGAQRKKNMRKSSKFPKFSWRELYLWRIHTLRRNALMDTKAYIEWTRQTKHSEHSAERPAATPQHFGSKVHTFSEAHTLSGGSALTSKVVLQGRLAVIDRDRLFTCDPIPKGGIVHTVHEMGVNTFIPKTLVWSPRGELLSCAIAVNGAETSSCFSKILFSAPNGMFAHQSKRRRRSTASTLARLDFADEKPGEVYTGPPVTNILALPEGIQCSQMSFSECGTVLNFVHEERTETALFLLDVATTITSLYGPSNGHVGLSPVPAPAEHVVKVLDGGEKLLVALDPSKHANGALIMNGQQLCFLHDVNAAVHPLSKYWADIDDLDYLSSGSDVDDDFHGTGVSEIDDQTTMEGQALTGRVMRSDGSDATSEEVQSQSSSWAEPIESIFTDDVRELCSVRKFSEVTSSSSSWSWLNIKRKITGSIQLATQSLVDIVRGDVEKRALRKRSLTSTSRSLMSTDSGASSCRRDSSWWSNIPRFRKLNEILIDHSSAQPLTRVLGSDRAKQIQWVPPRQGDPSKCRGFWLMPSANLESSSPYCSFLVITPAPSDRALKKGRIMPFVGPSDGDVFSLIRQCTVVEILPPFTPEAGDIGIGASFLFAGSPGGRHVAWTTHEGLYVRCLEHKLDEHGDWADPPQMAPEMKIIDFDSIMTGKNQWNERHDEINMRNYPAWNGSHRVPVLSVTNEVIKFTVNAIQWSSSGERLLILLSTHLAHERPSQAGDYYTVHQWVCWDPPAVFLDYERHFGARTAQPTREGLGTLSFGSRFISSKLFATDGLNKMQYSDKGYNIWNPEENAVAFSLTMPKAGSMNESIDYIVIQHFPRVRREDMQQRCERGEIPPIQQPDSVESWPYYLNYVPTALEYVCEGSYCNWSP